MEKKLANELPFEKRNQRPDPLALLVSLSKTKSLEAVQLSSSLESERVRPLGGKHPYLVDLAWIEQAEVLRRPLVLSGSKGGATWFRGAGKFRFFARGEMSGHGRYCCKSLFASPIANSPGRTFGDRIII